MNRKALLAIAVVSSALLVSPVIRAQTPVKEDFTGATTQTPGGWYYFNGACLTASSSVATSNPGLIPGCSAIKTSYYNENLVGGINGVAGSAQTLPDPVGQGALRFTNGCLSTGSGCANGGHSQNGAIISSSAFPTGQGLQITFKTVTYRGDSGGNGGTGNVNGLPVDGNDGADGISFFLLNGSATPNIGSWGGSLAYTCSNSNPNYNGLIGAYVGLGIDEYGNFLNPSDNTVSGPGLQANRIGLRGSGNINFAWLSANYASDYPASLSGVAVTLPNGNAGTAAEYAVYDTCRTGRIWNFSGVHGDSTVSAATETSTTIPDYQAISNGYSVLSGVNIANEYANGGYGRGNATPILYNLKITQDGLLSLQYSYNGGAYLNVLTNQNLSTAAGALPSSLYFGFAGSTGGSSNIHEILCFSAQPNSLSASSGNVDQKQSAQLNSTTQAFFAFYNPNDWTGRLTANRLGLVSGSLVVSSTPTWDASCVLTGETATQCATGVATTVEAPTSRVILSYNGGGIPFEWTNLGSTQKTALSLGDATGSACYPQCRLNYLRGDRTQEVTSTGSGLFRARDNVLADIVDSSPTWVGPPSSTSYAVTWKDRRWPTQVAPENSGTQTYAQYQIAQQGRLNVVYAGANDGLLHGFRAGSQDANGNLINNGTTPNDGYEVLAYMPGSTILSAASSGTSTNCVSIVATQTVVQNIHGETPAIGSAPACTNSALDYSNTQYGHNFFVDATPGTGDLFYNGSWHTWLVGGLGAGGSAIYALNVTSPTVNTTSDPSFTESHAANVVIGEWTSTQLSNLGKTYGTPVIRRLHNGQWAAIFGNGFGSSTGDAGIYIMSISSSGTPSFYYLSTGKAGTNDGIAYVAAADLDGDGITDYVYAGDLLGNVWRFDLTSTTPSSWAASPVPLINVGEPITTQLVVAAGVAAQTVPQIMIAFGTGQKTPLTNASAASYASGTQTLYGVWDWNLSAWNAVSAAQYASLPSANVQTCVGGTSVTLGPSNLAPQTIAVNASNGDRDIATNATVLWPTSTSCSSSSKFGWLLNLPGVQEQIIFNPEVIGTAFVVNSIVPAVVNLLNCNPPTDTGFTYAVSLLSGGAIPQFFQNYTNDASGTAAGIGANASGTSALVVTQNTTGNGTTDWLVYQTLSGTPSTTQTNPPNNITGSRLTWVQLR